MADTTCIVRKGIANLTCQFQGDKNLCFREEIFQHEDDLYCLFHLPVENKDDLVKDRLIKDELRYLREGRTLKGEKWSNYDYVIDDKSLKLSDLSTNSKIIKYSFVGSKILGNLAIQNISSEGTEITFENSQINGDIEISSNRINSFNCKKSEFDGSFNLTFKKIENFYSNKSKYFNKLIFDGGAGSSVDNNFSIENCSITSDVEFITVMFRGACFFKNIKFKNDLKFNNCSFMKGLVFNCERGIFAKNNIIVFESCGFNYDLDFSGSCFESDVILNDLHTRNEDKSRVRKLLFHDTKFSKNFSIDIRQEKYNPVISSIELIGNKRKCIINNFKYNNLWLACKKIILKNYIELHQISCNPEKNEEKKFLSLLMNYLMITKIYIQTPIKKDAEKQPGSNL